jgi:choline-glycine betaine transporter
VSPEERRDALRTLAFMLAAFVILVGGGSGITRSLVATIGVAIGAFVLWAFGATAIALSVESRRKRS